MKKTWIAAAALLVAVSGCGDSEDPDKADDTGKTSYGSDYAGQVNRLCQDLEQDLLAVIKDNRFPTGQEYLALAAKRDPLFEAFDAKVDEIDVDHSDEAARAFDAYREESDAANQNLAKAAATSESAFRTASAKNDEAYDRSSVVKALDAAGIYCPAR